MKAYLKDLEYGSVFKMDSFQHKLDNVTFKSDDSAIALKGARANNYNIIAESSDTDETTMFRCYPKLGGKFQKKIPYYISENAYVEI